MTFEIGLVFFILGAALLLFITEIISMDLVALLVLVALALSGLVSPAAALAGFSNPAVITVWSMFILSSGLTRTGVAALIGRIILGWTSRGEIRAIAVISLTAAVLSAFMNNIGVAALMLPAVVSVARRSGIPPSRLLMPLAYGSLLGGLTTLIGTPPNLLVSNALREHGLEPFSMFDFTPVGGAVMIGGLAFIALAGRHILPKRDPAREASAHGPQELARQYRLEEGSAVIRIPEGSPLAGRMLRESRLGSAARLNVFTVQRGDQVFPAPAADFVLAAGDLLHAGGTLDRFQELRSWSELVIEGQEDQQTGIDRLSREIKLAELRVVPGAPIIGRSLRQVGFRKDFSAIVVALQRGASVMHSGIGRESLQKSDRLLVLARPSEIKILAAGLDFEQVTPQDEAELTRRYDLGDHMLSVRIPPDSALGGKRLVESRLGEALGVGVLALRREETHRLLPGPNETLQAGDVLFVRGARSSLEIFRGLQGLEVEHESVSELGALDSDRAVLVEALLSPRTRLAGKSVGELRFRERYGLQLLSLLRRGEVHRTDLRDKKLEFGDALLLIGSPERASLLRQDGDLILMADNVEPTKTARAPLAMLIMGSVVASVLLGWFPIAIAAVSGAALMVLTRCLTMDQAYRAIEWRSIFLIAGMLPLGTALADTGAAALVAENIVSAVGPYGPWAVLISLCLITSAGTTVIPTAALVVLLAPIALTASDATGLSPYAVMMAIAMTASASFTSPVSHPANVLVMGPGGYRFSDYVKLGVPLTIVVLLIVFLVLPFVWPLTG